MRRSALLSTLCLLCLAGSAVSQQAHDSTVIPATTSLVSSTSNVSSGASPLPACSMFRMQTDSVLTLKQRACLYEKELISPQFALQAGFIAAFGHFRNSEHLRHRSPDQIAERFGYYYARHAARDLGEITAGYLHHEDPRFHPSNQQGLVRRTGSALLSVIVTRDDKGAREIALAPIAGSLSSGMVSTLMMARNNSIEGGLHRAGFVYSSYFIHALLQEYKPELSTYVRKLLHRQ